MEIAYLRARMERAATDLGLPVRRQAWLPQSLRHDLDEDCYEAFARILAAKTSVA